ncbi:hypothetical protein B0H13DRAFT_1850712 [Mycena leptocephala]|nr:hypothetical protein B0H13DRAFT_1850712 [Mycena leptocephala]
MNSSFSTYAAPSHLNKFSARYFDSLTFHECVEIVTTAAVTYDRLLPIILPPNHLLSFRFDTQVPTAEDEIAVGEAENIPHISDLLAVTRAVESAYTDRHARSVWLTMTFNGKTCTACYHFSKLRLVINICNNFPHIKQAAALLLHFRTSAILDPSWINAFGTNRIHEPVQGFQVSRYPLYKLACLLNETWIEDGNK